MNAQNLRLAQLEEHSRQTEGAYALRLNAMKAQINAQPARGSSDSNRVVDTRVIGKPETFIADEGKGRGQGKGNTTQVVRLLAAKHYTTTDDRGGRFAAHLRLRHTFLLTGIKEALVAPLREEVGGFCGQCAQKVPTARWGCHVRNEKSQCQ